MEKYDIYKDISRRTEGDIYIGVVGPVRTGKSTFISKFMEKAIMPNISNKLHKQIATDEMPQSAEGKTVMTTQPKFVPANAVKVQFKNKTSANVRLVDCVGYMVDGANGHLEEGKPRLVKTPWSDEDIPFEKAAEIGTRKVIKEYSTIGIVVTTDGSFTEIPRENYRKCEERIVNELKELNKPFVVVLNCKNPSADETVSLCKEMEEVYGVPVIPLNALEIDEKSIGDVMERLLYQFPMLGINVNIPKWLCALPAESPIIKEILDEVKGATENISKMCDYPELNGLFSESDKYEPITLSEIKLDKGTVECEIKAKDGLFYKVLSEETGDVINNDYELMYFIKTFSAEKRKYEKVKDALKQAEDTGYGVVMPTVEDMNLEDPLLVKKGGRYGLKLKASAPSLHIMKVDVSAEVSPIVGSEKQGEEMVNSLMKRFEDNPSEMWNTDMFGKSLHDMVGDSLSDKINGLPKETCGKLRKTLTRIVNENRGGIICILL